MNQRGLVIESWRPVGNPKMPLLLSLLGPPSFLESFAARIIR